jgi:ribosomal protection tetracycline resistance protein
VLRRLLNLGILAHVDAGKTTLTERLLHAAGVIGELGSVDKGTTQTDSLPLEQRRGITIKSAVVSFPLDGVTVNLIDTPGHPDFIAEVERVLGVLDGAVLVVSAVEGVQAQTRILFRSLQRLRIPTVVFVNKIDRAGSDCARVLAEVRSKLTPTTVELSAADREGGRDATVVAFDDADAHFGSRLAEVLAEHDDALLGAYLDDATSLSPARLRDALVEQTHRALAHPVYVGSALTGAGTDLLAAGIAELLPARADGGGGPPSGVVFKIERGPAGDRVAYLRMFSGTLRARDRVRFGRSGQAKVTAVGVFERGRTVQRASVSAGQIAKVWGLAEIQIGDCVGEIAARAAPNAFPPPTFESAVAPVDPADAPRLRLALTQLAEQDPLIDVHREDAGNELSVSLYGEVQQEVIEATLADDYGLWVAFSEVTPIHVERPLRSGEALALLHADTNPFFATIGLRVQRASVGSGIAFLTEVDPQTAPLHIFKTLDSFAAHMEGYVRGALREGLYGWQVTDCTVTLTRCNYSVADGPPSRRGPDSTAADFRKLTPVVLRQALERAGTVVCEPTLRVTLDVPADTIGSVVGAIARLGGVAEALSVQGGLAVVETALSAIHARDLQRELPGLTRGEGVLESRFAGYEPVAGAPRASPRRARST